jgi:Mlc titration factor MtfA (ptsG expression regulator)
MGTDVPINASNSTDSQDQMKSVLFFVVLLLIIAGTALVRRLIRMARRKQLRSKRFPSPWCGILEQNLPLYKHLPEPLKEQLHGHIMVFVAEKNFEGLRGLAITDEIKVTIAGQACMLLLNRDSDVYPKLFSILVYPDAYKTGKSSLFRPEEQDNTEEVRLGESWKTGSVVLAWDHVRHGATDRKDGHNLVLHEFAHQLDQEDGRSDGAPILEQRSHYIPWARVLSSEYERLRERTRGGRKTVMDRYGATNPAEFFAVATETFFEKPKQMKKKHPELYEELKNYYKIDPVTWGVP